MLGRLGDFFQGRYHFVLDLMNYFIDQVVKEEIHFSLLLLLLLLLFPFQPLETEGKTKRLVVFLFQAD